MSRDLAEALQAALDDGCSLAELEATLLARGDIGDQIDAAWLYAWSYDALRPRRDSLAARITNGAARDDTPQRRLILDAALERSVIRGTLAARSGHRRDFHGWLELNAALEAMLDTGADHAPNDSAVVSAALLSARSGSRSSGDRSDWVS
jgi:hypothetical protein